MIINGLSPLKQPPPTHPPTQLHTHTRQRSRICPRPYRRSLRRVISVRRRRRCRLAERRSEGSPDDPGPPHPPSTSLQGWLIQLTRRRATAATAGAICDYILATADASFAFTSQRRRAVGRGRGGGRRHGRGNEAFISQVTPPDGIEGGILTVWIRERVLPRRRGLDVLPRQNMAASSVMSARACVV